MTDIAATDRFDVCLPYILKGEGGNDDDPNDPGGRTSRGIIQREYDAYRRLKNLPPADVWHATDEEVRDIYLSSYWLPWCPKLPPGVDLCYFDMAVNSGPHEATKLLQRALRVNDDGHFGVVTLGALADAKNADLVEEFSDQRRDFYRSLRTFKYFGKGWLSRVQTIENAATKMVPA